MNTAEMVVLADKTGKKYKVSDMYYQKNKGFTDEYGEEWTVGSYDNLNCFIHENGWEEVVQMTRKEIAKILGYEVEIVD